MKQTISTIGYEGATIGAFVTALRDASIDILIDVRDLPLSRKNGFSKKRLAQILAEADIDYIHLKGLGDPKDGRNAARAGDYGLFRQIFWSPHENGNRATRYRHRGGAGQSASRMLDVL